MSLILEALRRSEAERRLGQAPDLLSPMPALSRRARAARLRRGGLVVVALLAVGVGAWWLGQRTALPPEPQHTSAPRMAEVIAGSGAESVDRVTSSPPAASPRPAPAMPSPESAPQSVPPTLSATTSPPVEPSVAPPPSAHVPAAPPGPASAADLAELRARLASAATTSEPPPRTGPATGLDPATQTTAPPRLSSLPADVRSALPPLRLTMHVYNETPAQRFVILDGRRLVEGAAIGGNLVLAEIRRDGVILDLDGRPLLLPRP